MALTELQRDLCRLIAQNRIDQGESYVAGGVALNVLLDGTRVSRDIDLFHDTREALEATWDADRLLLERSGYTVEVLRERPAYVEARVIQGQSRVLMQWTCDSAYRFFPLMRHDELGLVLHPFDLATNKVLALVGRVEARDWIDVITCHEKVQRLGYLAWAACGKDPGFSPLRILEEAKRSSHYTDIEIGELAFTGQRPRAADLAQSWHGMLSEAEAIIELLPPENVGQAVLGREGTPLGCDPDELRALLASGEVFCHSGVIRGAFPRIM